MNSEFSVTYSLVTKDEHFDPQKYFSMYDHYEIYDANKIYNTEPFDHDYGKGTNTYLYEKYIVEVLNGDISEYIVSPLYLKEHGIKALQQLSRCEICNAEFYHIISF